MRQKNSEPSGYILVNYYLKLIGLITILLGLSLLFWPGQTSGIFFNHITVSTEFFTRITGSTLLGYAALNIIASYYSHAEVLRGAVWGNLTTLSAAAIISVLNANQIDNFAWLIIAQHIIFAAGFGYCAAILRAPPNLE